MKIWASVKDARESRTHRKGWSKGIWEQRRVGSPLNTFASISMQCQWASPVVWLKWPQWAHLLVMPAFRAEEGLAPSDNPCYHSLSTIDSTTFSLITAPYHIHGHLLLPDNLHFVTFQTTSSEATRSLPKTAPLVHTLIIFRAGSYLPLTWCDHLGVRRPLPLWFCWWGIRGREKQLLVRSHLSADYWHREAFPNVILLPHGLWAASAYLSATKSPKNKSPIEQTLLTPSWLAHKVTSYVYLLTP